MDDVIELYKSNKLIIRAMDSPGYIRRNDEIYYDCSTWATEFESMQLGIFSSVSSTLLIPNVPVSTYKNVGFLINSDTADCFHICKSDSGSCGNMLDGDFSANKPDFETISELAEYIIENKDSTMNEVNFNADLSAVVGLVVCKCTKEKKYIKRMLAVQNAIERLTGKKYGIYEYDKSTGKISPIEITDSLIKDIINETKESGLNSTNNFYYVTDNSDEIVTGTVIDDSYIQDMVK